MPPFVIYWVMGHLLRVNDTRYRISATNPQIRRNSRIPRQDADNELFHSRNTDTYVRLIDPVLLLTVEPDIREVGVPGNDKMRKAHVGAICRSISRLFVPGSVFHRNMSRAAAPQPETSHIPTAADPKRTSPVTKMIFNVVVCGSLCWS